MEDSTASWLDDNWRTTTSDTRDLRLEHFDYDDFFYYFLASIGVILFCFWSRSRVPGNQFHIWERRRVELRELEARTERMSDPDYRMGLILKALIIRKIVQDKGGELLLGEDQDGDDSLSTGSGSHQTIDSMDENANTCVICLDSFRKGDVVAWSRMLLDPSESETTCNHVFHKECIVSWLMHGPMHDACPYCRSPIVKEGTTGDKGGEEVNSDRTATLDESGCTLNSAFVIMHGLVSRIRRARSLSDGQNFTTSDPLSTRVGALQRASAPPASVQTVASQLEGQSNGETVSSPALRRRPRSFSSSSLPEDALHLALPPGSPVQVRRTVSDVRLSTMPLGSPIQFRKTVSDVSSLPSVPLPGLPRPRRFGQSPMMPYPLYLRTSSFHSMGSAGRDVSECTITEEGEEEELIIRQMSPMTVDLNEYDEMSEHSFHSDEGHGIV